MLQTKEQEKTSEKEKEMKIINVPDKKFEVMVIKMLTGLGRRMNKLSENFNKEKENMKKNQS